MSGWQSTHVWHTEPCGCIYGQQVETASIYHERWVRLLRCPQHGLLTRYGRAGVMTNKLTETDYARCDNDAHCFDFECDMGDCAASDRVREQTETPGNGDSEAVS